MARKHTPEHIEQLKRNISILHLCADHGIVLKRHGTHDYIGNCPFHDDKDPSFIVTPGKNLWHCLGCDQGGSVIDLVMQLENLTFKQAVDKLMTSTGLIQRGVEASKRPELPREKAQQLLERVVAIYEKNLADSSKGRRYLEGRGIQDAGLFLRHRIGWCNGGLHTIIPDNGELRKDLQTLGILTEANKEHFAGCLVVPVFDPDGTIVTLYGRYTKNDDKKHVFLPRRPTGLWNVAAIKTYSAIILTESVIDALSVEVAGHSNVIAIQGTNGLKDEDIRLFAKQGVRHIRLLLDGDAAGIQAAQRLKGKIQTCTEAITVTIITLPDGLDPNSYLQKHGAEKLAQLIMTQTFSTESGTAATPSRAEASQAITRSPSEDRSTGSDFIVTYGRRTYRIMGLDKGARKLRATVRIETGGKLHVDTLDFYSAKSRRILAQDVCRLFDEVPETIDADITRLIRECESYQARKVETVAESVPMIPPADKREAEAFGRSRDLIKQILDDYETCGLIGEEPNKLLSYVAAVSRKTDTPLSVLVLSSSGAGKTALQDTTLSFVPPEDLVKLTSLSGKALFYKESSSLKHKALALEEGAGAEEAGYAIRNLITAGELVIETAIKDSLTGRITTMTNRVEGPTAVFITTTDPYTDPETKSRFFITSIDESREQTRKIQCFQRHRQTLGGMSGKHEIDVLITRHRNFQRLLKPLVVVNPFAEQLTYGDDRLQGRRDQPKYLNLIKAITFLRQMSKSVKTSVKPGGSSIDYIEVDPEDIRIANTLAHEILGRSLDELSRPSRDLLMQLDDMVAGRAKTKERSVSSALSADEYAPDRRSVSFTRREIRESTGWNNARVHRYLKELVDLEYVLQDAGRNGATCRYRLAYEGQGKDGSRFMLGLLSVEQLESLIKGNS